MDSVNKTLYIPLYGKALVSRMGLILEDRKAEEIWAAGGLALKGKAKSKWLAYYMAMRSRVFDDWVKERMAQHPDAAVLHLGCGLDSRCLRVGGSAPWYDVDFPQVIKERRKFYEETETYRMIPSDIRGDWLPQIPGKTAIVLMEGISMYLRPEELAAVLEQIGGHFASVYLLTDCYTTFAAKMSKYKNPINEVGVTQVYGLDDPKKLELGGLALVREHAMTPEHLIRQLDGMEQTLFRKLYAGKTAGKLYRMYEYKKEAPQT